MNTIARPPLEAALEVKFCALDLKRVTMEGNFEGYASLFDREDLGGDIVQPGAFRQTLAKRGTAGVRMLFQHDPNQPIGVWQHLHEDARGLFARGRLMTEVAKGREVLNLMRAGAVDGLSIGFRATRGVRDRRTGIRKLAAVDPIVTFPMQPEARVATVKANRSARQLPTEREFERWLTQDAGFSRSQARAVMRKGYEGLGTSRDAGQSANWEQQLARQIGEAARLMRTTSEMRKDTRC